MAGLWQNSRHHGKWMKLRSSIHTLFILRFLKLNSWNWFKTCSKSLYRTLYLWTNGRVLKGLETSRKMNDVEIINSRIIYSTFFESWFLKLLQNLFKVDLACSVALGKRPDFDRIRNIREKEWCWDCQFTQHLFSIFRSSTLKIASKPVQSRFNMLHAFGQTPWFWNN